MTSNDPLPVSPHPAAPESAGADPAPPDPVRARRAKVAKWNQIATRVGYLLFTIAIVMFFVALTTGFSQGKVTIITTSMILGSVLLAPAIVVGYAVKAAEKDDVSRGL